MNAVVIAVIVMLVLSLSRVHVVLSLTVGAFVGGVVAGMPLQNITDAAGQVSQAGIIPVFNKGLEGGAKIALSYAMLGAFAMAITHSGLPQQLAGAIIRKLNRSSMPDSVRSGEGAVKWLLLSIILVMGIMSQNVVPIHIAFIPMIVPPLLLVFNRLKVDRRLVACVITFGLVTTYMFLPYGFGAIFLNEILLGNIHSAAPELDVKNINVMAAMAIPALGMVIGLLLSFVHYRKPRLYQSRCGKPTSGVFIPQPGCGHRHCRMFCYPADVRRFAGIGGDARFRRIYDVGRNQPQQGQRCLRGRHQDDGHGRFYHDCGTGFCCRYECDRTHPAAGRKQHGDVRRQ